jgi:hypothetical protein
MVKVEVDVDQVLTVAVHLELEPGDKVLVMNGLVIGMVEARKTGTIVVPVVPPPPAAPPPPEPPSQEWRRRAVSRNDVQVEAQIRNLLRDKELTAAQIAIRLKAQHGGERLIIRDLMVTMRNRKVIEAVNQGRFPTYRLTPGTLAEE